MQTRIYIETTIPSFYHTQRTDPQSVARMHWTRQWWDDLTVNDVLLSSIAVLEELRQGTGPMTPLRIGLLNEVLLLPITEEVIEVAQVYIDRKAMPCDPTGDALHLAIASFYKVDALLTWNCRHLANANKFDHIRRINFGLGLPTPLLVTPLNYLNGEDNGD